MTREIIENHCKYCSKPIEKNKKYCDYKCGKLYRRYNLNVVDFKKFDLQRRTKSCEVCGNLFIDNTSNLNRLHCSISCQNFKYYHNNREYNVQRAKTYREKYPERIKEINKRSRLRYRDRHLMYMKEWHNIRKLKEILNKEKNV